MTPRVYESVEVTVSTDAQTFRNRWNGPGLKSEIDWWLIFNWLFVTFHERRDCLAMPIFSQKKKNEKTIASRNICNNVTFYLMTHLAPQWEPEKQNTQYQLCSACWCQRLVFAKQESIAKTASQLCCRNSSQLFYFVNTYANTVRWRVGESWRWLESERIVWRIDEDPSIFARWPFKWVFKR
jgi:hypothetical protein